MVNDRHWFAPLARIIWSGVFGVISWVSLLLLLPGVLAHSVGQAICILLGLAASIAAGWAFGPRIPRGLTWSALGLATIIGVLPRACNNCVNYSTKEFASPDGRHLAITYYRGCGIATNPPIGGVFLFDKKPSEKALLRTGNVYSCTNSDAPSVSWKDDRTLEIVEDPPCEDDLFIERRVNSLKGVNVVYKIAGREHR